MLSNYLIVALRNLLRQKVHSAINISGLAIGIAFCILSFLFVRHEWTYDSFHENADRIFLAYQLDREKSSGATPPVLAPTLQVHIPEIERIVRISDWQVGDGVPVHYGDRSHTLPGLRVDPGFLEMLSFPQVAGNPQSALQDIDAVVISRQMAHLFFAEEASLGRRIQVDVAGELQECVVTGVVDVPEMSSLQFDFLLPYREPLSGSTWASSNVKTLIQLPKHLPSAQIEQRFDAFFAHFFDVEKGQGRQQFGCSEERLRLLSLRDLHLNTVLRSWPDRRSYPVYSYVLSGIALAVLLVACVNFINLSLGLSSTRFREVGMRKVLGARRVHLVRQFWGEAVLMSLVTLILGIGLAELCLPVFERLIQRELSLDYASIWPALVGIAVAVSLVTGSYPSLVLSRFQPVEVMKGRQRLGGKSWLSRGLVVVQFALSIALIVVTLMMHWQLAHMRTMDLGFNAQQVVVIDPSGRGGGMDEPWGAGEEERKRIKEERRRLLEVYRQVGEQHPGIVSVSMASVSFGKGGYFGTSWWDKSLGQTTAALRTLTGVRNYVVDYDYLGTLEMELMAGRDFSPDFPTDEEESILVNEMLVRKIFDGSDPLGKEIPYSDREANLRGRIIGVVRDSHIKPLQQDLEPAVFKLRSGNGWLRYLLVRIRPDDIRGTMALLTETWQKVAPDRPFVYSFLDKDVERTFREDERWAKIIRYAALFAIFVACLGAFGLTSLAVARRTREIGIRKVMGASVPRIVALLSRELTWLVVVANVLAWPLAYVIMSEWLQNFAFRIDQGTGAFVLGGSLALAIVWLAMGLQAVKAALPNPVEALRYE